MTTAENACVKTIIIRRDLSNAFGIASFIFGLISIFVLAPLFVPLCLLFGILAIIQKQLAWGAIGLLCGLVGFITSPILMGALGISTILANVHGTAPSIQAADASRPRAENLLSTEQQQASPETTINELLGLIKMASNKIDATAATLPKGEANFHAITAKVQTFYEKAQSLSGDRNSVPRNKIIVAMNQGTVATNQLNAGAEGIKANFSANVDPLLKALSQAEKSCAASDNAQNTLCQNLHDKGNAFKAKCKTLSDGLKQLETTYQTELAAQESMIAKAEEIE